MKYFLNYRYKKWSVFKGLDSEWISKRYLANDKNDLIEKINFCIREYAEFYITDIVVYLIEKDGSDN